MLERNGSMVLVFNSSPLIYLSKVGLLELVGSLPVKRVIPEAVFNEVIVRGKEKGASDAFVVERVIEEGIIEVRTIEDMISLRNLVKIPGLHRADAEVLSLARELSGTVVVDDEKARSVADAIEIPNHGTAYLLFRFQRIGLLSKNDVREKLDEMIRFGWRCSTEVYAEMLRIAGN